MRSAWIMIVPCFLLLFVGCAKHTTAPDETKLTTRTLLTGLEYPKGLWLWHGKVYFTEANGRNTIYGGKNAVSVYDPDHYSRTVLRDPIVNSEAVVVDGDGTVYLGSWHGSVPGNSGAMSVLDSLTHVETQVVALDIAVVDMFIGTNDDIYVIGSSDDPLANSVYKLPVGNYASPIVLHQSLGRTLSLSLYGSILYYSDLYTIYRFVGGTFEIFGGKGVESMSVSTSDLFYAEQAEGRIGRFNISTKADQILLTGLHEPTAVRWDATHRMLYVLEAGTDANQYKDGTLKVVTGIR